VIGLIGNLGALGYFQCVNFGVQSFNQVVTAMGVTPTPWADITMPISLSFHMLRSVSYRIDLWRRHVPESRNCVAQAAFKAIFSHLIVGPAGSSPALPPTRPTARAICCA